MTANVEALVREGIRAYRAGNKTEARTFLEKAVELDQYHEEAWLWLSAVVDTKEEQRTCLENVLVINPNNARAKQGLLSLGETLPSSPSADDLFAETSFTPAPPANPSSSSLFDDDEEDYIESSVQWGAPPDDNEPARPPRKASALTSDDYDNWINSLNIGASTADRPAEPNSSSLDILRASTMPSTGSAFDVNFGDDDDFSLEGAAFSDNAFDQTDFASAGPFSGGPFAVDEELPPPTVQSQPARTLPKEPILSPMADTLAGAKKISAPSTSDIFNVGGDDLFVDSDSGTSGASVSADPDTYLQMIPKAIKPTRLPGVVESYPPLVLIGLVVLIIANLAALGLAISRLIG